MGDFCKITDDSFSVSIEDPIDDYINSEVGGISLVDFEKTSTIDAGEGKYLEKYNAEIELTALVYSSYPVNYHFDIDYDIVNSYWLILKYVDVGIQRYRQVYNIQYANYDHSLISSKNGGEYDLDITTSFSVPFEGQTIGGYQFDKAEVIIRSMETISAFQTGIISKSDPRYNSDSGMTEIKDQPESQDPMPNVQTAIDILAGKDLGFLGESQYRFITDSSMLNLGMGTNSRLATGDSNTLTGVFECQVGAQAYHLASTMEYARASIEIDNKGLFQDSTLLDYVGSTKIERTISLGVDNYFVSQRIKCEVEIITAITDLSWEETDNSQTILEPPTNDETIDYDEFIAQDDQVEIQNPDSKYTNADLRKWIIIGVSSITLIGIIYARMKRTKVNVMVLNK